MRIVIAFVVFASCPSETAAADRGWNRCKSADSSIAASGKSLGLRESSAYDAIKAVGNYVERYEKTSAAPAIRLNRRPQSIGAMAG